MIKQCERCHSEFDGHFNCKYCDECRPIVRKEKHKENDRKRRERCAEQLREYQRQWRKENPDYYRQWNAKNPDYRRRWQEKHPDYWARWRKENPDYFRQWRAKKKRERIMALKAERLRAKIRATMAKKKPLYSTQPHWTDNCALQVLSL